MSENRQDLGPDCPQLVLPHDYSTLLTRHNALVEAVAWERECWNVEMSVQHKINSASQHTIDAYFESDSTYKAARAEVDRLIATTDCEGEGWKKNR